MLVCKVFRMLLY